MEDLLWAGVLCCGFVLSWRFRYPAELVSSLKFKDGCWKTSVIVWGYIIISAFCLASGLLALL